MSNEFARTSTPPPNEPWCTLIVPCYNEFRRLSPDLFYNFLESTSHIRFFFANDGSTDQTLSLLEQMHETFPERIRILNSQANRGKAESVRQGMLLASQLQDSAFTGFWDADLATPLDFIPKLLRQLALHPGLQMIFGSRVRLMGHAIDRKAARHYAGRVFATFASASLALPIYDTQCGAKIFRINADLPHVLASPFVSRWIFDVELIARFLALHKHEADYAYKAIYELPLDQWKDVAGSKVSPLDFLKSLFELIQIRARYPR